MTHEHDEAQEARGVRWGNSQVRHGRIPDWVLNAEISDRAIRVYLVLGRYADADGESYPGKPLLCERLGCSRPTLDRAMAELVKIGALVVEPRWRSDGGAMANNYILEWMAPEPSPADERVDPPYQGREGQEERVPVVTITKETDVSIRPLDEPPADQRVAVQGKDTLQSLPMNALAGQCGVDLKGRRVQEVTYALFGKRDVHKKLLTPGITHMFWTEVLRWDEAHPLHRVAPRFHADPASYAEALARQISIKAAAYRTRMPDGTMLTPTALAKWWLDLDALGGTGDDRIVTADQVRELARREREA